MLEGGEDAMANFLADAEAAEGDEAGFGGEGEDEGEVEQQPRKKAKKWFQEDKLARGQQAEDAREIETFDDLEAEAARLLG